MEKHKFKVTILFLIFIHTFFIGCTADAEDTPYGGIIALSQPILHISRLLKVGIDNPNEPTGPAGREKGAPSDGADVGCVDRRRRICWY